MKHIYYNIDNRVSKHPFLKFVLLNLGLRKKALAQGSFVVAQQLADAHLSIADLKKHLADKNESVPRQIINIASNLPNTHPFWKERRRELESILFFRLMEFGDMPAYFDTMSCAEYHCLPLLNLLILYHATVYSIDPNIVRSNAYNDHVFRRSLVLKNLHIVTTYFDARTINYYATVMKEVCQYDDIWWRYEFAKSRGAIHSHGIIFSKKHHEIVKKCKESANPESELFKWFQTSLLNDETNNIYSPEFVSLHPGGGEEVSNGNSEKSWVPDKTKWAAPEGTQTPPHHNPLSINASEAIKEKQTKGPAYSTCKQTSLAQV